MPEICCLCFLFSPSTLSHQHNRDPKQEEVVDNSELLEESGELAAQTGLELNTELEMELERKLIRNF